MNQQVIQAMEAEANIQIEEALRIEADALSTQRQRDLDAALADAIEIVARHRVRLGRRICTTSDGKTVRVIFETLRGMLSESSDPGFQG